MMVAAVARSQHGLTHEEMRHCVEKELNMMVYATTENDNADSLV